MRSLILGVFAAITMLVTGCQTAPTFATPDASWKSAVGQLKYTTAERTVVGEVVVSRTPQEFQLEFLKGGSFRLLKISVSANRARAEGLLARGTWQGPIGREPRHLRHWLQLPAVFAAADDGQRTWSAAASGDSADLQATAGNIEHIHLRALSPDEDFVFRFQP